VDRRSALAALALLPLSPALLAFNPKPLDDYRRHHLFILAPAEDAAARALAERIAGVLGEQLPDSRAEPVVVAGLARLGAFLASRQFDVAVMATSAAEALAAGRPPFVEQGTVPLRVLHAAGSHLLVCRTDFVDANARRIALALGGPGTAVSAIPLHSGVDAPAPLPGNAPPSAPRRR
jgi:hypothetical protein